MRWFAPLLKGLLLNGLCFSGLLLWGQTVQAEVRSFDTMIASGVLKVAVYEGFAPYSFEDNDQPRGVDVDLAAALAKSLGVRLELLWAPPGEKLDDDLRDSIWRASPLRNQQLADVMMRVPYDRDYALKRNDQGELQNGHVVMFGPYQTECWQVAYDRRRLEAVPSVAVFQKHPIGVEVDSVPSFYLTSVFNGMLSANTHHYPNVDQAFVAMRGAEIDAVMGLRGEIDWQVHQAHDSNLALAENAYPNMGRQRWDIGMAVHESNHQMANALEQALETLIHDGSVQKIYARYGLRYDVPEMYQ